MNKKSVSDYEFSLLNDPFQFAPCFDKALKNVIAALPDRPRAESSDDTVCYSHTVWLSGANRNRSIIVHL